MSSDLGNALRMVGLLGDDEFVDALTDVEEVNYPALLARVAGSLRAGLPDSMTRLADTLVVSTVVAVSTGVNESEALVRPSESLCDSEDVTSE